MEAGFVMKCEDVVINIDCYLRGELEQDQIAGFEKHLAACSQCQQELAEAKEFSSLCSAAFSGVRAPDGFSQKVSKIAFGSTRSFASTNPHYTNLESSFSERIIFLFKSSPYFGASIALHAAAAVLIVALLLNIDKPVAPEIVQYHPPVIDSETVCFEESAPLITTPPAVVARIDRPSIRTRAVQVEGGVRVNIAQFVDSGEFALLEDKDLGCIRAYSAKELITNSEALLCEVKDSEMIIPESLAFKAFSEDNDLFVIEMDNWYEFWSLKKWRSFATFNSALGHDAMSGIAFSFALAIDNI